MNALPSTSFQGCYTEGLILGRPGQKRSPFLYLQLLVLPGQHLISGCAELHFPGPLSRSPLLFPQVSGKITHLNLEPVSQLIWLSGTVSRWGQANPPTLIEHPLEILLAANSNWQGKASFYCGPYTVENLPIHPLEGEY